jgi:ABC-type phosphate transport system substrate-binding protein
MQKNVMKGLPMRTPLKSERVKFMSGLISRVADYQNTQNALGYSFRYYTTIMQHNEKLRLLSIDGIAPTVENISQWKISADCRCEYCHLRYSIRKQSKNDQLVSESAREKID